MTDQPSEPTDSSVEQVRPFMDTLRDLEFGVLLDQLGIEQRRVIDAVLKTNCKGELNLKLVYKETGPGQINVSATVTPKIPQLSRGQTLFFVTEEKNLQRDNPRQHKLPLKGVGSDKKPIKEAN